MALSTPFAARSAPEPGYRAFTARSLAAPSFALMAALTPAWSAMFHSTLLHVARTSVKNELAAERRTQRACSPEPPLEQKHNAKAAKVDLLTYHAACAEYVASMWRTRMFNSRGTPPAARTTEWFCDFW